MNLVKAFLEYYHCIGVIPTQLLKEIPIKRRKTKKRSKGNKDKFRQSTNRKSATVHIKDISITYDSEMSLDVHSYSPKGLLSSKSPKKGEYTPRKFIPALDDSNDHYHVSHTEPTLSIIDINEMLALNWTRWKNKKNLFSALFWVNFVLFWIMVKIHDVPNKIKIVLIGWFFQNLLNKMKMHICRIGPQE